MAKSAKPAKEIQKVDPSMLAGFMQEAKTRQEESTTAPRPPYIRIVEQKKGRQQEAAVRLQYPEIRDEEGKPIAKQAQDLRAVLLAHIPYRELKYRDEKGQWHTEGFAVGVKKEAYAIGDLFGAPMPMADVDANWKHFDTVRTMQTFEGNVETAEMKWNSKIATVWLVDPAFWLEEDEPLLAMAFISNSSFYGNSIEEAEDAELRDYTLRAFPVKGQGEHKGVLLRLNSRPWEFGTEQGITDDEGNPPSSTPTSAIWMHIFGSWLGTPRAVHSFEIGEELELDELQMVTELKPKAEEMMIDFIAGGYRFAHSRLDAAKARALAVYAFKGQHAALAEQAGKMLPARVVGEPIEEERGATAGDDLDDLDEAPFSRPGADAAPARGRRTTRVETIVDDSEFDDFDD